MSPRLLAAVLRLLPTNQTQSADNPLQVDRLPENLSGVELDYPVYQDSPEVARRSTGTLIFVAALIAPALAWTAHLVPFPYLHGGINTLGLLIAAGFTVFGIFGRWSPMVACVIAAAVLPILALLVRDVPYPLAAAIVALAGTAVFADSLLRSFLFLKTAAPMPRESAQTIRAACLRRWISLLRPLRGAEFWSLNFLLIPLAAWLVLKPIVEHKGHGDFWGAVVVFSKIAGIGIVWTIALEAFVAPLFGRRPYSIRARITAIWRSLIEWCNYNRLNARGVGVHLDPCGDCATRRRLLIGVLLSWTCVWGGLQLQSPRFGSAFLDMYVKGLIAQDLWTIRTDERRRQAYEQQKKAQGSPESNLPQLSDTEKEFVRRLGPTEAEQFLKQRRATEDSEKAAAAAIEKEEIAQQHLGEMLWTFCLKLGEVAAQVLIPSLWTLGAVFGLVFGISGRALAGVLALSGGKPRTRILSTENWELLTARVRQSEDEIEQNSVFLGTNSRDDTPVLVPRKLFHEHAHVLGDSGSGKTSMGLIPLITQLMRFGDCSIVLVDLKADDQFLFESLRDEADKLDKLKRKADPKGPGYRYRWFTTVLERSSFAFNPLTQVAMPKLGPDQRTDVVTAALGLQYGSDYGRKYFGDANYDVLYYALCENPNVESFAELETILAGAQNFPLPEETKKAGSHVRSSVRRLSRCRALNACPSQRTPQSVLDNAIDLSDLFVHPQALYVALPPAAGISSTAEIARIFLYSLLAAAQSQPRPRKQVFLIVDEFQRIVSKNVELFLQQARSMGIGCIFSNQSLADLASVGSDLVSAVRGNTRFRQVFGAGNQTDIDDLTQSAGETLYGMRSWSYAPSLWDMALRQLTVAEHRGSRLSVNDILLATDAPGRSITSVRRGDGYAQFGGMPFIMDSVYHIDPKTYENRIKAAWPPQDERTLVATIADATAPPIVGNPPTILPPEGRPLRNKPVVQDEAVESSSEGIDVDGIRAQMEEDEAARIAQLKAERRKKRPPPSSPFSANP